MNTSSFLVRDIKNILLLAVAILINQFSFAIQVTPEAAAGGVVKGKIVSKSNGQPIEYANVVLYSLPDSTLQTGAISAADGSFLIADVAKGSYYIVANFIGFYRKSVEGIEISGAKKVFDAGMIQLEVAAENLAEVAIVDERNPVEYHIDKKVVNISKKLDAAGGSVANALENTPSIQVDMEGNVSLRGSANYTVLIDGKPTAMSSSDALKQIPASIVENVEIITNPSAKYDPEGTSGIINIVMKKNVQKASNGIINLSAGTYHKYSGDFSLNYYSKKVNFFLNGDYSNSHSYPFSKMEAWKKFQDTTYTTTQEIDRNQVFDPYSITAGMDWNINPKNSFTAKYQFGHWGMDLKMDGKTKEVMGDNLSTNYKSSFSNLLTSGFYHTGTLTFDHDFEKKNHDIVMALVESTWNGENITDVNEKVTDSEYINSSWANHHKSTRNDENVTLYFKTDYTLPLTEKSKMEAGVQIDAKLVESDYKMELQDFTTQDWQIPAGGLQNMSFSENIYAVYSTYSGEWKKINYMAGLRAEYFSRNLKMPDEQIEYPLEQFSLFPTLHLSRQLKKGRQLQASYSRRVNRPREWTLNPFPVYSDSYVSQMGNPYLKPEFTDSYELNLMQRVKPGFLSLEMFYRQTNDAFNRTLTMDSTGLVLIETRNMGKNFAYGLEFSTNLGLVKWLNIYASANLFSYNVSSSDLADVAERQSINSDFVLNATFKINDKTRIQLVGFYNAPRLTSQGNQFSMYGANLSIARDFMKKKLHLTLTMRDLFYTMNFGFITDVENLYSEFNYRSEYPVIILQASYKINDYKRRQDANVSDQNFGGGIM